MEIADLLQLRDSGSSAVDSTNANERNRQFNRILVALGALGAAFETSFIGGAGTSSAGYTPVLSSGTGTFTSAAVVGRFLTVGKFTFIRISVTITTNGTAATDVRVTLPIPSVRRCTMSGRRTGGNMLMAWTNAGAEVADSLLIIANYDNTYPGADGAVLIVSGWYENDGT